MPELYARNSRFQKSHCAGRSVFESRSQALRISDQSRSTPSTSALPLQRKSARALGLIPIQLSGAWLASTTRTSFVAKRFRKGTSSVLGSSASRPTRPSSSLVAVERVSHRQLAHPVLEQRSDSVERSRGAL